MGNPERNWRLVGQSQSPKRSPLHSGGRRQPKPCRAESRRDDPGGQLVSEGGHGLAWLDLEGRKRFGQLWVGGVWTGATHLARDAGLARVSGVYAYAGAAWNGGGFDGAKPELRLAELLTQEGRASAPRDARFGKGWDRPLLVPNAPGLRHFA